MAQTLKDAVAQAYNVSIGPSSTPVSKAATAVGLAATYMMFRNVISNLCQRDVSISSLHSPIDARHSRRPFVMYSDLAKLHSDTQKELSLYGADADALLEIMINAGGAQSKRFELKQNTSADSANTKERDEGDNFDFEQSASVIRAIMGANLLKVDDLARVNMAKLFTINRLMTSVARIPILTSTAVRFTIQYNLFAGTVANLGSDGQKAFVQEEILAKKDIGAFILTEVGAGVVSGAVIETVAVYQSGGGFKLHCPTPAAVKNWVCNGMVAKWGIVVARLLLPSSPENDALSRRPSEAFPGYLDFGPHTFLVHLDQLDKDKTLTRTQMPKRVACNSLDVASLNFQNAVLPNESLLSALCSVSKETGVYNSASRTSPPPRFEIVAQRLLAGRICISGAALGFLTSTIREIISYDRQVPSGKGQRTRSLVRETPAIRDLIDEAMAVNFFLSAYVRILEQQYVTFVQISPKLAETIAVGKMVCVEAAIYYTLKLKGVIGSWSLTAEAPFGSNIEALYAYKFAEGDTNILVQKVGKDAATRVGFSFSTILSCCFNPSRIRSQYSASTFSLARTLLSTAVLSAEKKTKVFLDAHRLVKEVAWRHAVETIRTEVLGAYPEFRKSAELVFFDNFAEILVKSQV